jgi:hypothetical protein
MIKQFLLHTGYWPFFFIGQMIFVTKRASSALRSTRNPISSRWMFVKMNSGILLVRMTVGELWILVAWRHLNISQISGLFGMPVPSWVPSWVSTGPAAGGVFFAFLLGYFADSILDWISQYKRLPASIKKVIAENIPLLPPENGNEAQSEPALVVETKTTVTAVSPVKSPAK